MSEKSVIMTSIICGPDYFPENFLLYEFADPRIIHHTLLCLPRMSLLAELKSTSNKRMARSLDTSLQLKLFPSIAERTLAMDKAALHEVVVSMFSLMSRSIQRMLSSADGIEGKQTSTNGKSDMSNDLAMVLIQNPGLV